MQRQVMNCGPWMLTVVGGTPRRVHSLLGRDGKRMGDEEGRLFPDLGDQLVKVVRRGWSGEGGDALTGVGDGEQNESASLLMSPHS